MVLRVAVIGGGPAGLVTLKTLLEAQTTFPGVTIDARLFEEHDDIGGVFSHQVYEGAELVSSKYLTAFSDLRLPDSAPDFLPSQTYLQYLKQYAKTFKLRDHIQLNTSVELIQPAPDGIGHVVHLRHTPASGSSSSASTRSERFHAIAICTGLNHTPYMPEIQGLNCPATTSTPIQILHSKDFKTREQFGKDLTVLILGVGETAMDLGGLAVTSDSKRVIMCHRGGFSYQPKVVPVPARAGGKSGGPDPCRPNKPIDCCTASLFDTAHVPPIVQRGLLSWAVYDFFIKNMAWLISGTRAGLDQWVGQVDPARFHADAVIFCKSGNSLPYISAQYRSQSILNKARSWLINIPIIEPANGKTIDLAPWPSHFEDGVVHFQLNDRPESKKMEQEKGEIRPDIVIFATGYQRTFPFLPINDDRYPGLEEATTRGIYRDIADGIAYIGYVRPSLGAIPPLAELQAQRWVHALIKRPDLRQFFTASFRAPARPMAAVAPYELDYKIHSRGSRDLATTKLAVDMESYAYQLAVDMGAAPSGWYVWYKFGWEVFVTWAMGPNFPTKFRLIGPWAKRRMAVSMMKKDGELGKVVRRTGGGVFFFAYTIIPLLVFGPMCIVINLATWLWERAMVWMKAI